MNSKLRISTIAAIVALAVATLPTAFAQSQATQAGYSSAQAGVVQTNPGHINNWPGAHNSDRRGVSGGR